jgi:menaquinol-cytochrome c reductase iron-sulfur subunit
MADKPGSPSDDPRTRKLAAAAVSTKGGHGDANEGPRRGFLYQAATAVIGGVVALPPLIAGLMVYLDPLRRKSAAGEMRTVATVDKLPSAATGDVLVGRYPIVADRVDAWSIYPNEPIGGVYLVVPKGTDKVKALNATCPHLGCGVDLREIEGGGYSFKCPCHTSAFTGDGTRIMPCVSPRDMDEMPCEVVDVGGRKEIRVKFENFQPGLTEKKVKA